MKNDLQNNQPLLLKPTKRVAIVYRPATRQALERAKELTSWLLERKYKVYTAPGQKLLKDTERLKSEKETDSLSLVVVLGGDGTYLRAARWLAGRPIPILGVNLGSLGFLTQTRSDHLLQTLQKILNREMVLSPRTMLKVEIFNKKTAAVELCALNDVVIERGSLAQLINLSIHLDTFLVSDLKADGLIVASPTGSTAYNLAAGGPILHPTARSLCVTPIAPHALTSRPLVVTDSSPLRLAIKGKGQRAHLVVDGQKIMNLTQQHVVAISKSAGSHFVVQDPQHDFFSVLREKLKFGDRA